MSEPQEQQRRAKAYAKARRRVTYLEWALGLVYVVAWLVPGVAPTVREAIGARWPSPWIVVPVFAVIFSAPYQILTFPLSVYRGFILAHRYGQSRQTLRQWLADAAKGAAVGTLLAFGLLEGLYAILRWQPATWWIWAAGGVLTVNVLLSHLAPVLLFPLFFTFKPLDDEDLRGRLLGLCERARTHVRGVFTFDLGRKTRAANAALAGLANTRRIILSDTLCEHYTPAEIEVVLAHELGHHVHGHLWKGIAASALSTGVLFWVANRALVAGLPMMGATGIADVAGLPLLALVLGLCGVLGMPMGNALSRHFERQADATALRLASEPSAMVTTMEKLADHNLADRNPHPLVHMLFDSHPRIDERISSAKLYTNSKDRKQNQQPIGV